MLDGEGRSWGLWVVGKALETAKAGAPPSPPMLAYGEVLLLALATLRVTEV